jgi:protein-S-isoprenylcysteine O-methyltransferase Ste14
MAGSNSRGSRLSSPIIKRTLLSYLVRFVGLFIILAAILFIPAGRLNWGEAWAFIIAYGLFVLYYLLWGLKNDPGQIEERSHVAKNVKHWDQIILVSYTFFLVILFIVAGLDAGRFRWAPLPMILEIVGWLGFALAGSLIGWVSSVNTFLSRQVRIQEERGHKVVAQGPYRFVRHPMYLGIILFMFSIPLVLGSGWAEVPALIIAILFVIRTTLEDRTLREELPGYQDYAKHVKFRLIPGIW